jgi:hypothetical protein
MYLTAAPPFACFHVDNDLSVQRRTVLFMYVQATGVVRGDEKSRTVGVANGKLTEKADEYADAAEN